MERSQLAQRSTTSKQVRFSGNQALPLLKRATNIGPQGIRLPPLAEIEDKPVSKTKINIIIVIKNATQNTSIISLPVGYR